MVAILMMPAKLATLGLLKIKVFWNKGWRHNFCLWSHQQHFIIWLNIADLVTWANFANSNLNFIGIWLEKPIFLRSVHGSSLIIWDWHLKFYINVAKWLKLKIRKFLGLISTVLEATGGKLVAGRGGFLPTPIVNRVN